MRRTTSLQTRWYGTKASTNGSPQMKSPNSPTSLRLNPKPFKNPKRFRHCRRQNLNRRSMARRYLRHRLAALFRRQRLPAWQHPPVRRLPSAHRLRSHIQPHQLPLPARRQALCRRPRHTHARLRHHIPHQCRRHHPCRLRAMATTPPTHLPNVPPPLASNQAKA